MHEERINIHMTTKCFQHCVTSFMEKLLTPWEKECMNTCLKN